ncbi:hypothetical protein HLH14_02105 [Acinetobacter sp. ANC 4282]|uniref:hypothetical protein n=1 Tax=Acinetobacter terrae TaxID=2731247 RepID=UPI00148FA9E0|nr:hypothetical protein [Acinetobacter terrae]NNH14819.1 hypothetical protein [Acinetobacter terrae]
MSIHNGINEIYEQSIQLKFKNKNGAIVVENWKILKDENIAPSRYDFVKEVSLDIPFECESFDALRIKYQVSIQRKLKNTELTIVEIINETAEKILTVEEQKELLNQIEIFSIKESLIFCE